MSLHFIEIMKISVLYAAVLKRLVKKRVFLKLDMKSCSWLKKAFPLLFVERSQGFVSSLVFYSLNKAGSYIIHHRSFRVCSAKGEFYFKKRTEIPVSFAFCQALHLSVCVLLMRNGAHFLMRETPVIDLNL